MRCVLLPCLLWFGLLVTIACQPAKNENQLTIFAAASLVDVLPKAVAALPDSFQRSPIKYNFASSSILARQIIQGAQPDLFFSANTDWTRELVRQNKVNPMQVQSFLGNKLVVTTPISSRLKINNLSELREGVIKKIAIGDPSHVPAGKYAKLALEKAGIWNDVAPKIVAALDTRAALAFVESGSVDAGIVYLTDARISEKGAVAFVIDDSLQPKIEYAVASWPEKTPATEKFLNTLLNNPDAQAIFRQAGFTLLSNR